MAAKKTDAPKLYVVRATDDEPVFGNEDARLEEELLEELEPIGEVTIDDRLDELLEEFTRPKPERIAELASSPIALEDVPRPEPTAQWAVPPPEKTLPLGSAPPKSFGKGGTAQWDAGTPKPAVPLTAQITLDDIESLIAKGEIHGLDPETDEGSKSALKKLKDDFAELLAGALARALGKPTKPGV